MSGCFVGIDVHRRRSQVAVLDEFGELRFNRGSPNEPAALAALLAEVPAGSPVAFEAGYGWSWLVELLEDRDLVPHLVHPYRCKAIASARLKDDRVDAATLALLLRADLLPEAWIAPVEVRQLRALLRHRAAVVRLGTVCKNRIHAVLADYGLDRPEGLWSRPGREWLAGVPLPEISRQVVTDCLSVIDTVDPIVARLRKQVVERAKPDPRVELLRTLPGVGLITAMTLVTEIGDIRRFPTARKLAAWAGLTPMVRNSSDRVRHGHISKMGSPWVRWTLTEAAQRAKAHPDFVEVYTSIRRRRGRQIATTALARRLLTRAFHLLAAQAKQADQAAGGPDRSGTPEPPAAGPTPARMTGHPDRSPEHVDGDSGRRPRVASPVAG